MAVLSRVLHDTDDERVHVVPGLSREMHKANAETASGGQAGGAASLSRLPFDDRDNR